MAISIQLLAVILFLFLYNIYFISIKKNEAVFTLMFVLLLFIPSELVGIISGSPYSTPGIINLSLLGYDIIIALLLFLLLYRGKMTFSYSNYKAITKVALGVFVTLVLRIIVDNSGFLSNKILDNYLLPIVFAVLLINYMPKERIAYLLKNIYIAIFINAIFACTEYLIGQSLFFHEYYMQTVGWYPNVYNATAYGVAFRCTSFLGHPLTNGMYFLMGVVYLLNNRTNRKTSKIVQIVILSCGILATNSRGALLVLAGYILYYLILNRKSIKFSMLVVVSVLIIMSSDMQNLYNILFFRDRAGSSLAVRVLVLQNIANISYINFLFGVGYNNAGSVFGAFVKGANAEISYLIILLENGIIGFCAWSFSLISLYSKLMPKVLERLNIKNMINGMLFCFLTYGATSNSFGDPGTLIYLLCAILAFSRIVSDYSDVNSINIK